MIRATTLALLAASVSACNSDVDFPELDPALLEVPADLGDPDAVRAIASDASAVVILERWPVALGWLPEEEEGCPAFAEETDQDGGVLFTYTGDCTDEEGYQWKGSIEIEVTDDNWTYRFEDFGSRRMSYCVDGSLRPEQNSVTGHHIENPDGSFDVELTIVRTDEPCESGPALIGIEYSGQRSPSGISGSGTYANSTFGKAAVSTADEVIDRELCSQEAVSGTTTLQSFGREAVITYDGAVDCDPEQTVTWTLDGVPQGEMEGIACSATGSAGGGLVFVGFGLLALVGRRRR